MEPASFFPSTTLPWALTRQSKEVAVKSDHDGGEANKANVRRDRCECEESVSGRGSFLLLNLASAMLTSCIACLIDFRIPMYSSRANFPCR